MVAACAGLTRNEPFYNQTQERKILFQPIDIPQHNMYVIYAFLCCGAFFS